MCDRVYMDDSIGISLVYLVGIAFHLPAQDLPHRRIMLPFQRIEGTFF